MKDIMQPNKDEVIQIRVPSMLKQQAHDYCREKGLPLSSLMRNLLDEATHPIRNRDLRKRANGGLGGLTTARFEGVFGPKIMLYNTNGMCVGEYAYANILDRELDFRELVRLGVREEQP